MPDGKPQDRLRGEQEALGREIERREQRKLRSRSEPRTPWLGLRMFGMVGWSVTVPTLLGLAAGLYLDQRTVGTGGPSWTLTLLIAGVIGGCFNAWFWVAREGGLDGRPRGDALDPATPAAGQAGGDQDKLDEDGDQRRG
jgi:ATP synthase protein I